MLNMARVSKNDLDVWRSISVSNTVLPGLYKFRKVFFFQAWSFMTSWRAEFLVWELPLEERAHMSTRARARASPSTSSAALHRTCSRRMSLTKCVFGCKGKITLFSFPKNSALCEQWMQFILPGQQWSFKCVSLFTSFRWRMFYKQGPVRWLICISFDTERWSGPSDKRIPVMIRNRR